MLTNQITWNKNISQIWEDKNTLRSTRRFKILSENSDLSEH